MEPGINGFIEVGIEGHFAENANRSGQGLLIQPCFD